MPGVYRVFTGESSPLADAWAAVLYAGAGASLDATPSLWLAGVTSPPPSLWPVLVPVHRRVVAQSGSPVTVSRRLDSWAHPSASPSRLRVEAAVLRATELCSTAEPVVDVVVLARDDAAARSLELALRYGWREVSGDPCGCADELAGLLRLRGWRGQLRRCGRGCAVVATA